MKDVFMAIGMILSGAAAVQAQTVSDVHRATDKKADTTIVVKASVEKGPIKPVNGVNGAPRNDPENRGAWERSGFACARNHDVNLYTRYGAPDVVDVQAIFRDFSADETKPENYDFAGTDVVVLRTLRAGVPVFYRLGGGFEGHLETKKGSNPPADPEKWARICEHIVAHYNEGWANGFQCGIEYWEIWNEPNLRDFWTGSQEQFTTLFTTTIKHLKSRFPNCKFGGPAMAGREGKWSEPLIQTLAAEKIPLDFYSWHGYATDPKNYATDAEWVRKLLDDNGFAETESILNEWNYVKDFRHNYNYSLEVMSGNRGEKGAAFVAATLSVLQEAPLDSAALYSTDGTFDSVFTDRGLPARGYYALLAWKKLRELGTAVETVNASHGDDLYATAAKNADGKIGILVTRYHEDNNRTANKWVKVKFDGVAPKGPVRVYLTDDHRLNTAEDYELAGDGSLWLLMRPSSFAYIEL